VKVEHNTCINTDHATTLLLLIIQGVQQNTFYFCFSFLAAIGRRKMFTLRPNAFYYFGNIWVQISSNYKRGCCIRSPLVTKHFEVVLLDENITQLELKKFQPLVYMWFKPTPSFSNVGATLLKLWAFFWVPFPFFSTQILQLVRKMLQSTVNLIVKVCVIIIYNIKSATGIC